jgi:hypothetical protein
MNATVRHAVYFTLVNSALSVNIDYTSLVSFQLLKHAVAIRVFTVLRVSTETAASRVTVQVAMMVHCVNMYHWQQVGIYLYYSLIYHVC